MLDDINEKLTKSVDITDQNWSGSSFSIEMDKLKQLKQDIIKVFKLVEQ